MASETRRVSDDELKGLIANFNRHCTDEERDRVAHHAALKNIGDSFDAFSDNFNARYARYLDISIEREATRALLRKAVIEKTTVALVWSGLVTLGYMVVEGVRQWFRQIK